MVLIVNNKEKPTIAVDFDGVIHEYSQGWKDGSIYDIPKKGVKEALERLSKKYKIVIFSTRNHDRTIKGEMQKNQIKEMSDWLDKHEIPFDAIHTNCGKPIAKLYIDDNAYRFQGNWGKAVHDIEFLLEND